MDDVIVESSLINGKILTSFERRQTMRAARRVRSMTGLKQNWTVILFVEENIIIKGREIQMNELLYSSDRKHQSRRGGWPGRGHRGWGSQVMCVSNNLHLLRSQEGKEALSYGFNSLLPVSRYIDTTFADKGSHQKKMYNQNVRTHLSSDY